jgi:hypothetical protein
MESCAAKPRAEQLDAAPSAETMTTSTEHEITEDSVLEYPPTPSGGESDDQVAFSPPESDNQELDEGMWLGHKGDIGDDGNDCKELDLPRDADDPDDPNGPDDHDLPV